MASMLTIRDVLAIAIDAGIPEPQARMLLGAGLVLHEGPKVRITLRAVIEWAPFADLTEAASGADT